MNENSRSFKAIVIVLMNEKTENWTKATAEYMRTKRCRESINDQPPTVSFDNLQGEPHQRRVVLLVHDTHRLALDDRRHATGYAANRRTEAVVEEGRLGRQRWLGYLHADNPRPFLFHRKYRAGEVR